MRKQIKTTSRFSRISFPKASRVSTVWFCLLFVSGDFLLSKDAGASREVLSDLDCVIEPSVVSSIASAVPGVIQRVHFERSDYVLAGTVLAELESDVEKASLELAVRVAELSTAVDLRKLNAQFGSRTHKRNEELFKKASISSQNMDQVKTESRIARLQVRQEIENQEIAQFEAKRAEAALQRRIIRSPFDGVITRQLKSIGEYVEGEPVFEIAQLDPLFVEVIVPLEHLGVVSSGMLGKITMNVPGFIDETLEATVRRIDSVADAASGTYGVRLELPNPDFKVPAGVRCQVDFISD